MISFGDVIKLHHQIKYKLK